MTPTLADRTPDWLARRGGELRPGLNGCKFLVLLGGSQQYQVVVTPAKGKYTCAVTQLNNGKRLDRGAVFPDADAALFGGLDDLRQFLGWE